MILLTLACFHPAPTQPSAPDSGWLIQEGDRSACFVAPDFSTISDQSLADKQRADTVRAMSLQWGGARRDGVDFGEQRAMELEGLLLDRPELTQETAIKNLAYCLEVMREGGNTGAWGSWVEELHEELTLAACPDPLEETYHSLSLDMGWQMEMPLCKGQALQIKASATQYYTLEPQGEQLTVLGNPEREPTPDHLCPTCVNGALILRFTPDDGGDPQVFEVGAERSFVAPSAGTLELAVNDADYGDNSWRVHEGIADGITLVVRPK